MCYVARFLLLLCLGRGPQLNGLLGTCTSMVRLPQTCNGIRHPKPALLAGIIIGGIRSGALY